jgi:hypothetical protein
MADYAFGSNAPYELIEMASATGMREATTSVISTIQNGIDRLPDVGRVGHAKRV